LLPIRKARVIGGLSDHPIFQRMPFHVKVDSDFHHGQAAQGETFGCAIAKVQK
jgi:hypothetical protein